jgi:fructokinase
MLSSESLEGTENQSKRAAVVVFGEVLFDCFPDGERVLGGAPFNVAWGLRGFGHSPVFISAVGDDADGQSIRSKMNAWSLPKDGLQRDSAHATGSVQVTIENDEPSYEICEDRAWDFIGDQGWEATEMIYHGLLGLRSERSRKTFEALVERSQAKRFFDINLRPPYDSEELIKQWIRGVDWLKLNIDELESLLGDPVDFSDATATESAVNSLRAEYGIHNVLLTGGKQGARIFSEDQQAACIPAPNPDRFVDTVGAGDSFSAYTLHGILSGMPLQQIVREASLFAAKVCGMQGATTLNQEFYQ